MMNFSADAGRKRNAKAGAYNPAYKMVKINMLNQKWLSVMKNDDFMESIFGCMERIEDMVKGLSNVQTVNNNTEVDNSVNIALLEEIKVLVENATGANCKYTERKIQELTKTLGENLRVINDNVKGVSGINKPEFESIKNEFESLKQLLAVLTVKIAEAKVTHSKERL